MWVMVGHVGDGGGMWVMVGHVGDGGGMWVMVGAWFWWGMVLVGHHVHVGDGGHGVHVGDGAWCSCG